MAKHSAPPSIWRGGDKSRMLTPAPPHHSRATTAGNQQASASATHPWSSVARLPGAPAPAAKTQPQLCRRRHGPNRAASLTPPTPGPAAYPEQIQARHPPPQREDGARSTGVCGYGRFRPDTMLGPITTMGRRRSCTGSRSRLGPPETTWRSGEGPRAALTSILQRGGPRGQIPAAPITGATRPLPAAASRGDEAGREGRGWRRCGG
jgi:hypothetical protein